MLSLACPLQSSYRSKWRVPPRGSTHKKNFEAVILASLAVNVAQVRRAKR